ncbi:MAG: hypothetical protein LBP75_03495 [Planctomycetota bacterium]|jgi:hypothetical protein|nr:hypothetical protein [Planctomycetota bacterium]
MPPPTASSPAPFPCGDLSVAATADVAGDLIIKNFGGLARLIFVLFVPLHAAFLVAIFYLSPQSTLVGAVDYVIGMLTDPEATMLAYDVRSQAVVLGLQFVYFLLNVLFVTPFTTGALTRAAVAAYLGQPLTAAAALRWAGKNLWRLVAASLYAWLVIGGATAATGLIFFLPVGAFFLVGDNLPAAFSVGVMLLALVGLSVAATAWLVASVKMMALYPALAAENCGAWDAAKRSARLTKSRVSRGLWLMFLGSVISIFPTAAINCIFNAGALGVLSALAQGFALLITTAFATVYYFSCRAAHENLDILLLVEK